MGPTLILLDLPLVPFPCVVGCGTLEMITDVEGGSVVVTVNGVCVTCPLGSVVSTLVVNVRVGVVTSVVVVELVSVGVEVGGVVTPWVVPPSVVQVDPNSVAVGVVVVISTVTATGTCAVLTSPKQQSD